MKGGAKVDPTTPTFRTKDPSGDITNYVYLTDAQCVKDAVGEYHLDLDPAEVGKWEVLFFGTGANKTAEKTSFIVVPAF